MESIVVERLHLNEGSRHTIRVCIYETLLSLVGVLEPCNLHVF